MTLISTPGSASANSFADVAWSDGYHATRPKSDTWTDADPDQQEAALIQATRFLCSAFTWNGSATDAVQALCWPRTGLLTRNGFALASTVIPPELKDATSEFARQLLEADRAADSDSEKQGITSVRAGSVSVSFGQKSSNDLIMLQAQMDLRSPEFAWMSRLIPDAVLALLVPSWYDRPTLGPTIVFTVDR